MQSPGALVTNSQPKLGGSQPVEDQEDLLPAQIVATNVGDEMGIDIVGAQSRVPKPMQNRIDLWENRVIGTPSPQKAARETSSREDVVLRAEMVLHVVIERGSDLVATGMFPTTESPYVEAVLSTKGARAKKEEGETGENADAGAAEARTTEVKRNESGTVDTEKSEEVGTEEATENADQAQRTNVAMGGGVEPHWVSENEFENTPNHLLFPCHLWEGLQKSEAEKCFLHLRVRNTSAIASVLSGADPLVGTHVIDLDSIKVFDVVSPSDTSLQVGTAELKLDTGGMLHASVYMTRNYMYAKDGSAGDDDSWVPKWLWGGGGGSQ
jgi:hypothetical protein